MNKISAVYKIVNTITGDFYVGSSINVFNRWVEHKKLSIWKRCPNSPMYKDFQKYGLDKFRFQILAPVMPEYLKQVEQEFIDLLHPTYNNIRANGIDLERRKEWHKEYEQSEKGKEYRRKYRKTEEGKEVHKKAHRKYRQTEKGKEVNRKAQKKYYNRLCSYNGETLTLGTLIMRFRKSGIEHPTSEAKKYLIGKGK